MRINRVPKKLWGVKIGELLVQSANKSKDSKAVLSIMGAGGVKEFVEDVRRLRFASRIYGRSNRLLTTR